MDTGWRGDAHLSRIRHARAQSAWSIWRDAGQAFGGGRTNPQAHVVSDSCKVLSTRIATTCFDRTIV